MNIESFSEAEAVIESAIKSEAKKLNLELSMSYSGVLPSSIGSIKTLEELTIMNPYFKRTSCIRNT
jgi:hypothetical protein